MSSKYEAAKAEITMYSTAREDGEFCSIFHVASLYSSWLFPLRCRRASLGLKLRRPQH